MSPPTIRALIYPLIPILPKAWRHFMSLTYPRLRLDVLPRMTMLLCIPLLLHLTTLLQLSLASLCRFRPLVLVLLWRLFGQDSQCRLLNRDHLQPCANLCHILR